MSSDSLPTAGAALVGAALLGLLGTPACSSSGDDTTPAGGRSASGAAGTGMAGGGGSTAGAAGTTTAGSAGAAGGMITSSMMDATMTLEKFTMMCDAAGGKLEIHPHCGGMNSCKGFSYDQTQQIFTEHTCVGLNTCTGWSCVLP